MSRATPAHVCRPSISAGGEGTVFCPICLPLLASPEQLAEIIDDTDELYAVRMWALGTLDDRRREGGR